MNTLVTFWVIQGMTVLFFLKCGNSFLTAAVLIGFVLFLSKQKVSSDLSFIALIYKYLQVQNLCRRQACQNPQKNLNSLYFLALGILVEEGGILPPTPGLSFG